MGWIDLEDLDYLEYLDYPDYFDDLDNLDDLDDLDGLDYLDDLDYIDEPKKLSCGPDSMFVLLQKTFFQKKIVNMSLRQNG